MAVFFPLSFVLNVIEGYKAATAQLSRQCGIFILLLIVLPLQNPWRW
jgi:hypothetical protein